MNKPLFIVAGCLFVVTLGFFAWSLFGAKPRGLRTPDELADTALNAASAAEQEQAALDLARSGAAAKEQMRRVFAETRSPEVKAALAQGLGSLRDWESMPALLKALEDPSEKVRHQAGVAVTVMIGRDYYFRAGDPPARRASIVRKMTNAYKELEKSPPRN